MQNKPGQFLVIAISVCLVVAAVALGLYQVLPERDPAGPLGQEPPRERTQVEPDPAGDPGDGGPAPAPSQPGPGPDEGVNQSRILPDGTGVIAGLAPPGSAVELMRGDAVIGTAQTSDKGEWVIVIDPPLEPGSHLLHVRIATPEGAVEVGDLAVVLEIPGGGGRPLAALVPYSDRAVDKDAPPRVVQEPGADGKASLAGTGPPVVNIRTIQALSGGRLQVTGDARGGDGVVLAVGGAAAAPVAVAGGGYAASTGFDAAADRLDLEVTLRDRDGREVARARVRLRRSELERALGDDILAVVQKGDALWRIAYRTYGQGFRFVEIFERNTDRISDPDLIYPDQIFVVPK